MSLIWRQGDSIVDRAKEAQIIESIIRETARNTDVHAIVLWADTGYGKSAIMRKVQSYFEGQPLKIAIVETPPSNETTPVEGQYLTYIADTLNRDLAGQLSLKDFLTSVHNRIKPLLDLEASVYQGLPLVQSGLKMKLSEFALQDLMKERLLFDTSTDSILLIKNYIEIAIQTKHIVLDITNAQNLDATSFRVLNQILGQQRDLTMVFEYTTQGGRTPQLERFLSQLNCPYTEIAVDALPFDFALTIYGQPEDPNKICEIEKFYRTVVKGNLYRIIQAKNDRTKDLNVDPIEWKIKELSYASKLLLVVLCLLGGTSTKEEFQRIREHIGQSFFLPPQWQKELDPLVEETSDCITLRHASIADALQLTPDNAVAAAAYKFLSEYYENLMQNAEDRAVFTQAVPKLAILYSQFDPSKLTQIIHPFREVIVSQFNKDTAIHLVTQAFEALGEPQETEFHFMLIALCYEAGFYDAAMDLLNKIKPLESECGRVFHCMLLNRTDLHHRALETCKQLRGTLKNPRYQLMTEMIQMLSERSLGLFDQCRQTSQRIERTEKYHSLLEYGFFLRNKQIILSFEESLPYIEQSIDFFEKNDQRLYADHSRLTHLVQRARIGHPQESEAELERIKPNLLRSSFEQHIVYLNQASLRLLQGIADEQTELLLERALLTVTTTFDRAVVLNNKLCALIIRGGSDPKAFSVLAPELADVIESEPDTNLRRKVYTNFALYYKMIGNKADYEFWANRVRQIKKGSSAHPVEDTLLFGTRPSKAFEYLATQPCYVFFITYWHFDIPFLPDA